MLKKAFRSMGTVIGEAIVAIAGLGTVYGLGWLSGAKSGAKFNDIVNKAFEDEERRKAAEAEKTEEEVPADEPGEEQQEETGTEEVSDNQPED